MHAAKFAEKAAFTRSQLASLAGGSPQDSCWTAPADRALLGAVDSLCATGDLDDETWNELVEAVGDDGAVEVVLLCGWYHAISFPVRALRLPLEPDTHPIEHFRTAS